MNPIDKYERRHTLHNSDFSLDTNFDDSTIESSLTSVSHSLHNPSTASTSITMTTNLTRYSDDKAAAASEATINMGRWRIAEEDISELPEIYPRLSYPLIVRDREVSETGDNLWKFFRANGVRSAYDKEQGRVLCCTQRVSFVVQFWKQRTISNSNENTSTSTTASSDNGIILEIQRRRGCSWAMHKIRSALKKSILRQQHHPPSGDRSSSHKPSRFPPPFSPPMQRSNSLEGIGLPPLKFISSKFFTFSQTREQQQQPSSSSLLSQAPPRLCISENSSICSSSNDDSQKTFSEQPLESIAAVAADSSSVHKNKTFAPIMVPPPSTFGVCPSPYWRRRNEPSFESNQF